MDGFTVSGYRGKFERTRIPEPVYNCGFRPEAGSYARYVNHISMCTHHDCERRFTNHLLLQTYFARKYSGESGTIPANDPKPLGGVASEPLETHHPASKATDAAAHDSRRADRSGIRFKNYRPIDRP